MSLTFRWTLIVRAICELALYDIVAMTFGFRGIERRLRRASGRRRRAEFEPAICEAVLWALSFYWKPVQCLQRAVVTARLLRIYCGDGADVVIGYRPTPFFSHAWVELQGRVINDSTAFQKRLHVLVRL